MVISVGWGIVFAAALPRRRTVRAGAVAGLAVAAIDLGLVGRRLDRIAALPLLPQLCDHVAYGASVGGVIRRRRLLSTRPLGSCPGGLAGAGVGS